ncbi:hypothetical protein HOLleu_38300 [Holothuria leucospilota]|uniref:RNA-directed DNA polymerase n=1 Tax=Holothuria leucospilota TaxID=206669 RepID=A0A9Q1BFY7_HOLLE|nr:hypothetical protein HOLleu_38300 [Holothuria leucospilota]
MADKNNSNRTVGPVTRSQDQHSVDGLPQVELESVFSSLGVNVGREPGTIDAGGNVPGGDSIGSQGGAGVNVAQGTAPGDLVQLELLKLIQDQRRELNARIAALEMGTPPGVAPFKLEIPRLTERDDIDTYLRAFEHLMSAYHISEDKWASHIAPRLTGKAREAYTSLPVGSLNNYKELKRVILARYQLNAEKYRQKFRGDVKGVNESYEEWGIRLKTLLGRWLDAAGVLPGETVDFQELILIEQALEKIPKDLAIWLREKQPKSLLQLTKLADEYVTVRGIRPQQSNSEKFRHPRSESNPPNFGGGTQMSASLPGRSATVSSNNNMAVRPKACFICNSTKHLANQCPHKNQQGSTNLTWGKAQSKVLRNNTSSSSGEVLFCKTNTNAYECKGYINGQEVTMLRDTGSDFTLVNRRLVGENFFLKNKTITLHGVDHRPLKFPVARVFLKSQYLTQWVKVGVSENLPRDVLLGNDLFAEPLSVFVLTRSQQREIDAELQREKDEISLTGVQSKPITLNCNDGEDGGKVFNGIETSLPEDGLEEDKQCIKVVNNENSDTMDCISSSSSQEVDIRQMQQREEAFKSLYDRLIPYDDIDKHRVCFYVKDKVLMRKWQTKLQNRNNKEYHQIVVPRQCREAILKVAHDIPMGGHLGIQKTRERILENFYWPGIFSDVSKYCRSCGICQKTTGRKDATKAPLHPLPIIDVPFKRIGMDLVGPLPRTKKGNRYVLVVVDYATRYPEAVPIANQEAETIAGELITIFSRVGIPEEIVSDQGANFTSKLMQEVCTSLEIDHLKSSPYHPQTNGLVERFNGTLKAMLRAFVTQAPETWDRYIPYLLFAYREVPQSSTGFSPFELLYGRKVRGPLDVIKEGWIGNHSHSEEGKNLIDYVLDMRSRMAELAILAQKNMATAQCEQKEWYDKTARSRSYGVGQKVLVFLPTASGKLQAEWQGPYEITSKVGDTDYEVNTGSVRKKMRIFHVNMMRPWTERFCLYAQALGLGEHTNETSNDSGIGYQPTRTQNWSDVHISDQLTPTQRSDVENLLQEFDSIMSDVPGRTQITKHDVYVTDEVPITQKAYRLPQAKRVEIKSQLEQMLEAGIIKPSTSAWASPIVSVPKQDGTIRICTDYRRLNQVTKFDAYPMPRIDDIIDDVSGAPYISTLDLTKGYYQVPLSESAREKSAFITPFGLFEYTVLPFGMKNSSACFQRLVDNVLRECSEFSKAYIDDIIIFSKTWEEHLNHLAAVLGRLRAAGLTVKPDKCKVAETSVPYLGYVIGNGKVGPEECKVKAIVNCPTPITKTDVRAFLGLAGYYRKLIPSFAQIASPLTDLTKKSKPNAITWSDECDQAFTTLKNIIKSKPVLQSPDFEKPFILQCDASERGLGAVLGQIGDDGEEHPVVFISRKLSRAEEIYPTIEKECLCIVWAVQKLQVYLLGRKFHIQTDHKPLVWLEQMKPHNRRLTRWAIILQEYDFDICHKKGADNSNADALSRMF